MTSPVLCAQRDCVIISLEMFQIIAVVKDKNLEGEEKIAAIEIKEVIYN